MDVKSSAYEVESASDWGKVETNMLKRDGEITEPWGTPVRMCLEGEMEWW